MPPNRGRRRYRERSSSSSSSSSSRERSRRGRQRRRFNTRSRSRSSTKSITSRLERVRVRTDEERKKEEAAAREEVGAGGAEQPGTSNGVGGRSIIRFVREIVNEQQETIADLLSEQRRELLGKVDSKKKHRFRSRILEKQYEVNENFAYIAKSCLDALEKGKLKKAEEHLKDLNEELEEHNDIIAADLSKHGWLTVTRLKNKSGISKNLLKRLEKEDDAIDRWRRKEGTGSFQARPRQMEGKPYQNFFVKTSREPKSF